MVIYQFHFQSTCKCPKPQIYWIIFVSRARFTRLDKTVHYSSGLWQLLFEMRNTKHFADINVYSIILLCVIILTDTFMSSADVGWVVIRGWCMDCDTSTEAKHQLCNSQQLLGITGLVSVIYIWLCVLLMTKKTFTTVRQFTDAKFAEIRLCHFYVKQSTFSHVSFGKYAIKQVGYFQQRVQNLRCEPLKDFSYLFYHYCEHLKLNIYNLTCFIYISSKFLHVLENIIFTIIAAANKWRCCVDL